MMRNTMVLDYEAVLYDRGDTSPLNIQTYGDISHYDTTPSPYSNTTSNGVGDLIGDVGFWSEIFQDILSNTITLTDFNTQQNQNNLPFPVTNTSTFEPIPFNSTNYFPSSNNTSSATNAQPINTLLNDLSLSDQEFLRQISNNPKKLADYAAKEAQLSIAVSSGLNIQESKDFYNSLTPNVKSQVEQAAINNFKELNRGNGSSKGFDRDLREIGLI
jgi:hypothetical protein